MRLMEVRFELKLLNTYPVQSNGGVGLASALPHLMEGCSALSRISQFSSNNNARNMADPEIVPTNGQHLLCKKCNEESATQRIRSEQVCQQVIPTHVQRSHTDMLPENVSRNM